MNLCKTEGESQVVDPTESLMVDTIEYNGSIGVYIEGALATVATAREIARYLPLLEFALNRAQIEMYVYEWKWRKEPEGNPFPESNRELSGKLLEYKVHDNWV